MPIATEKIDQGTAPATRAVGAWLLVVAGLVALMIVLGGATRLTQSGLSMVEWQPLTVLPPLDEAAWQQAFADYQRYPEYQKLNRGMSLDEFKAIFWFEYLHRLLGRLIGVAFLVPFLWFLARGRIRGRLAWQLGGVFLLGGMQGAVGWWMVKSGLVDRPDVSHYRLAVHLALALAIFGLLLRLGWRLLLAPTAERGGAGLWLAAGLVYLQALSGALVAGLDAGLHYNTFPTMNGLWLPPELWQLSPAWLNLLENPTTVQFDHRLGAYIVTLVVAGLWWRGRRVADDARRRRALDLMLAALVLQLGIGIATLLLQVPVVLGVLHQTGAVALFAAVLFATVRSTSRAP